MMVNSSQMFFFILEKPYCSKEVVSLFETKQPPILDMPMCINRELSDEAFNTSACCVQTGWAHIVLDIYVLPSCFQFIATLHIKGFQMMKQFKMSFVLTAISLLQDLALVWLKN